MVDKDDNTIQHPLSLIEATKLIHDYVHNERAKRITTSHARDQMRDRTLHPEWIETVLQRGSVTSRRFENGSWRYKVTYTDQYASTYVVTAIPRNNVLVIVTVIRD